MQPCLRSSRPKQDPRSGSSGFPNLNILPCTACLALLRPLVAGAKATSPHSLTFLCPNYQTTLFHVLCKMYLYPKLSFVFA